MYNARGIGGLEHATEVASRHVGIEADGIFVARARSAWTTGEHSIECSAITGKTVSGHLEKCIIDLRSVNIVGPCNCQSREDCTHFKDKAMEVKVVVALDGLYRGQRCHRSGGRRERRGQGIYVGASGGHETMKIGAYYCPSLILRRLLRGRGRGYTTGHE